MKRKKGNQKKNTSRGKRREIEIEREREKTLLVLSITVTQKKKKKKKERKNKKKTSGALTNPLISMGNYFFKRETGIPEYSRMRTPIYPPGRATRILRSAVHHRRMNSHAFLPLTNSNPTNQPAIQQLRNNGRWGVGEVGEPGGRIVSRDRWR